MTISASAAGHVAGAGSATAASSSASLASLPPTEIAWFQLAADMLGGLALTLYGLSVLSTGLKLLLGDRLRELLRTACGNRVTGFVTGTAATALLSSSTATSLLVVSFVESGDMTFEQSLGVSLGINVGSTVATQLLALKMTKYGLLLVGLGYLARLLGATDRVRFSGDAVLGLGLLFVGMEAMGTAMDPLKHYPPFLRLLGSLTNPLLGFLASTLFTLVVQSSAATAGIVMMLAREGIIPLSVAISTIAGANVGTCGTTILAALGKRRSAMRVAVSYLLFKVAGAVLVLLFLPVFKWLVVAVAGGSELLAAERGVDWSEVTVSLTDPTGGRTLSDAESRLLALQAHYVPAHTAQAHTLFNLLLVPLFLPFTNPTAQFLLRLIPPEKEKSDRERPGPSGSGRLSNAPSSASLVSSQAELPNSSSSSSSLSLSSSSSSSVLPSSDATSPRLLLIPSSSSPSSSSSSTSSSASSASLSSSSSTAPTTIPILDSAPGQESNRPHTRVGVRDA